MQSADGQALPAALPGQYVVLRLHPAGGGSPLFRSYSLSGPLSTERYRISVKIEPGGAAGTWLREHVRVNDVLDVSSPRGSFILQTGDRPLVLLSAGIGATPVMAMLQALAAERSTRQVLWIHAARDREHHPFAAEVRRLIPALTHGRIYICYSRPGSSDRMIACAVACWCAVAWRLGELSQQPTWPQLRQIRRCTHLPPSRRQSSQPSTEPGSSVTVI